MMSTAEPSPFIPNVDGTGHCTKTRVVVEPSAFHQMVRAALNRDRSVEERQDELRVVQQRIRGLVVHHLVGRIPDSRSVFLQGQHNRTGRAEVPVGHRRSSKRKPYPRHSQSHGRRCAAGMHACWPGIDDLPAPHTLDRDAHEGSRTRCSLSVYGKASPARVRTVLGHECSHRVGLRFLRGRRAGFEVRCTHTVEQFIQAGIGLNDLNLADQIGCRSAS